MIKRVYESFVYALLMILIMMSPLAIVKMVFADVTEVPPETSQPVEYITITTTEQTCVNGAYNLEATTLGSNGYVSVTSIEYNGSGKIKKINSL